LSHDLQTAITRMRLRVEMLASSPARATDLLDNAIKFAGGAELVIEQIPPDTVDMVVRDKGPGIPASALRRATHGTTKTIAGHAYSTGPSASFRIEPWNHRP